MGADPGGADVRAVWRSAETRFYAAAAGDRDTYAAALGALRASVAHLRETASVAADLERAATDPAALLAAAGVRTASLPAELLVGTACATVVRELDAAATARRHADAIETARTAGREWAVLEGPERLVDLTDGRHVLRHVGTGRTVVASLDPWSGGEPFVLDEPGSGRSTFPDRDAWLAAHREATGVG